MKIAAIFIVYCAFIKLCVPFSLTQWGVPKRRINELVVGGDIAIAQDFPWHAAIFHNTDGTWSYKCGGSLISELFVITAKHCIMEQHSSDRLPVENIMIKFGLQKYTKENKNSQNRAASKIFIVKGNLKKEFRNDIALVELAKQVNISAYVLPVLLVDQEPAVRTVGIVVGFGFTKNNKLSESLLKLEMPIIDTRQCIKRHSHFEMDLGQFCAGHIDAKTACNGDSGGGLVFEKNGAFYLGGIVSYSDMQDGKYTCKLDGYSVFTNVNFYLPWINRIANLNLSLSEVSYINDQPCGVSKINRFRRVVGGQDTTPEQWPWHAHIDIKRDGLFDCSGTLGGTLINDKFVLTVDACFIEYPQIRAEDIFVKLGMHRLDDPELEYYEVDKIFTAKKEKARMHRYSVALLKFSNEVVIIYSDTVRPICQPISEIETGTYGTTIGFGYTNYNTWKLSSTLQMTQMLLTNLSMCEEKYPYHPISDEILCVSSSEAQVCIGDGGGGIFFKGDNGAWYIHGVNNFAFRIEAYQMCDYMPTMFIPGQTVITKSIPSQ